MTAMTVGREEFDRLARQIERIDNGGTAANAVLAVQVQELAKDLARHEVKHDRQEQQRAANRKWMVMAFIAAIAAIDGPVVTIMLAKWGH